MAERPDEIKRRIERHRERLGENLEILQNEVVRAKNWKTWVERKPLAALGLAFVGGLWLSTRF